MTDDRIRREITLLRIYAGLSALAIAWLVYAALSDGPATEFDTIRVQRIDVVSASGLPALSIAGHGRLPGPTFEGREYPQDLSGGRTVASGMIFFNERGDEVGGLTYHGQRTDDGFSSYGGVTFDQFQQDQVVSLQYQGDQDSRRAGVHVWDRSPDVSLAKILELVSARRGASGAALDSIQAEIAALAERGGSAHRVFLGSENRTAVLRLEDTAGRTRVRMYVDSMDVARLEFLDEGGSVVGAYPG